MSSPQIYLLRQRRFLPLFLTMFLGAFNDNLFKNALIVLATFRAAYATSLPTPMLAAIASGVFVLPFFLFSAMAGQLADKYEKAQMTRILKWSELAIMLLAVVGFYMHHTWFLIAVLFCLGAQSAFFGPIKYSILPDHLKWEELVGGNALVEVATFLAILAGTITGGLVVIAPHGEQILCAMLVVVALLGILSSRFIPYAKPASPELAISPHLLKSTWGVMTYAGESKSVFRCVIGIAWFWFVGATFVSQFPPFVRDHVGGNEEVVTTFLTAFSIGVAIGAILCGRLLRGKISARFAPVAMVGVALSIVSVVMLSAQPHSVKEYMGVVAFFAERNNILLFTSLLTLAMCAGFVSVPLFSVMQSKSAATHRARVIAASNIMDALFMIASALLAMGMAAAGFSIPHLFAVVAVLCLPVAWLLRGIEEREKKD